jgi:3-hydroxyisobutyrate dehydrogenase
MHDADASKKRIGFVGLGTMGGSMAVHLHKHSLSTRSVPALVHNRSPEKALAHASEHGTVAIADLATLASRCDVICACLSTTADVTAVFERLPLERGTLIIDATSGDPEGTRALGESLRARGVRLVDAPVSGGPKGAVAASLTSMMGGDDADVEAARQYIGAWSGKMVQCGPLGAGDAVKAVNNMLNTAHLLLATEGLLALQRAGVAPATALDVINSSSGGSTQTARYPTYVLSRSFDYGFALPLMRKDVGIAAGLAADGATLFPEVHRLIEAAEAQLGPGADYTEIAKLLEGRAGVGELRAAAP